MGYEIDDIVPREGVFDVKVLTETGTRITHTFRNEKWEDDKWKDIVDERMEKRNSDKIDKKDTEIDIKKKQ